MSRVANGAIPERPNRPLVVRCSYERSSRRVNFPSAATCRLESLRNRVEECFSLSAAPYSLIYTDDDGEEFSIRNENDLTEAISYFISGDDDAATSTYSGSGSGVFPYSLSTSKITLRLDVVVEYDGPSLSDTSSISSFQTGSGSEHDSTYRSSAYESSYRGSISSMMQEPIEEEYTDEEDPERRNTATQSVTGGMSRISLDNARLTWSQYSGSTPRRMSERNHTPSNHSFIPKEPLTAQQPLTGPDSAIAPSLLTHSELGTRWLREQSSLAARKIGPGTRSRKSTRYDSDDDSMASDDERSGDFALVRDARGRYYYSYQTDVSSATASDIDLTDHEIASHRHSVQSSVLSSRSPPSPPHAHLHTPSPRTIEPAGPPILAPDCSACGVRLDYLRYVCQTCGEGEMWMENAPGKAAFVPPKVPSDSSQSDASSEVTEFAAHGAASSSGSRTVYNTTSRSRSGSISTNASRGSVQALAGSSSSPTNATCHFDFGFTPPHSPISALGDTTPSLARDDQPQRKVGYELCAGCIEIHGIRHTKAAARTAKNELRGTELRRREKAGQLRHTFKERIWGPEGWTDVEYNEDLECTICRAALFSNRFKCVSCPKFDLCRSCYQKVDEIHPAHAFLSLPDKPLLPIETSRNALNESEQPNPEVAGPQLVRHPGAFCHNCLQDIVGPRFHCAVCPSWDLCIQCEGIHMAGGDGSGHLSDHIMMKIPVPLPTSEVEAVSRRARDRWFQQDRTVATSGGDPLVSSLSQPYHSRSSSPIGDNSTLYAPTATRVRNASPLPPSQIVNVSQRDALDHGVRCGNCNEWIMGRRYQCANCPSDPVGFNLCSICELRSYRVHDPTHFFFKFDRPVHIPIRSYRPVLPPLYRHPVGKVPASALATINPRDPTAYLKHVMHRDTLCDVHGDQIRGVWLRCAHCAAGFDICLEAERIADHDATHVFVVFKARVDMAAFRQLADLAATHSKPLLRQSVYVS
ncbi:hypothetical protein AYX14_00879 [Cryptococcus neoformans]|nr:hypothetical protein AYX15_00622 [Cryptococcus neoformans var. grubii]OWZ73729.1 hypothetical protein AYX14_00879 [Cryptococcus neoformans var. grubii]